MSVIDIGAAIIFYKNTSNAYVLRLSRARFTLLLVDYNTQDEGSLFRIMPEQLRKEFSITLS